MKKGQPVLFSFPPGMFPNTPVFLQQLSRFQRPSAHLSLPALFPREEQPKAASGPRYEHSRDVSSDPETDTDQTLKGNGDTGESVTEQ